MTQYRIYLRTHDQKVVAESKTTTGDRATALGAFATLIDRTDLDGTRVGAVLSADGGQIAMHRFDKREGNEAYWRGRLDDLRWPDGDTPTGGAGGARPGAGRKVQTSDGGQMRQKTVTLDTTTVALLTAFGDGELSEGIRRAARVLPAPEEI